MCVCVCVCVSMWACMCVCACVHLFMCVCVYLCVHMCKSIPLVHSRIWWYFATKRCGSYQSRIGILWVQAVFGIVKASKIFCRFWLWNSFCLFNKSDCIICECSHKYKLCCWHVAFNMPYKYRYEFSSGWRLSLTSKLKDLWDRKS